MIPILGSLIEIGGVWLKGKQEETKAKAEAKLVEITADSDIKKAKAIAAIRAAETGQQQDFDLDRIAMEQMGKSWKDELVLIIFLAPMVMAFIPGMDKYSLAGFEVIKQMPEWYQYIIIGMVVVIYGMRGMVKQLVSNKLSIKKD
tara:strand:- start:517 stop:951 length:435 start_codon:yes stop_codon:yes gene_type:complete